MKDKIADGRPAADGSKRVTFDEAERVGAFELASRWAGRLSWSFGDRAASEELAGLVHAAGPLANPVAADPYPQGGPCRR